jgi:hypothetical protein
LARGDVRASICHELHRFFFVALTGIRRMSVSGTSGSNPLSSSGESDANLIFEPETGEPADRNIGWHAAMPAAITPPLQVALPRHAPPMSLF